MNQNQRNQRQGNGQGNAPATQDRPEPQQGNRQGSGKDKPVHELRMGVVKAAIWENANGNGAVFYNVTFSRLYKDDNNNWCDSKSFGRDELPLLVRVAQLAYDWIYDPKG